MARRSRNDFQPVKAIRFALSVPVGDGSRRRSGGDSGTAEDRAADGRGEGVRRAQGCCLRGADADGVGVKSVADIRRIEIVENAFFLVANEQKIILWRPIAAVFIIFEQSKTGTAGGK